MFGNITFRVVRTKRKSLERIDMPDLLPKMFDPIVIPCEQGIIFSLFYSPLPQALQQPSHKTARQTTPEKESPSSA